MQSSPLQWNNNTWKNFIIGCLFCLGKVSPSHTVMVPPLVHFATFRIPCSAYLVSDLWPPNCDPRPPKNMDVSYDSNSATIINPFLFFFSYTLRSRYVSILSNSTENLVLNYTLQGCIWYAYCRPCVMSYSHQKQKNLITLLKHFEFNARIIKDVI